MTQVFANPNLSAYRIAKTIAFLYGMVADFAFFVTILDAIGFVMGFVVPKSIDTGSETSSIEALLVNLLLMSLFAVQYSVMARRRFKACMVDALCTEIRCLMLLFWQRRPMPAILWQVEEPDVAVAVVTVSLIGCRRTEQLRSAREEPRSSDRCKSPDGEPRLSRRRIDHLPRHARHALTASAPKRSLPV